MDEALGQSLMLWSVRLAVLCYLLRVFLLLGRRDCPRVPTTSECVLWSIGCLFYLAHVCLAFDQVHHWSHQLAFDHTAAETRRLTGWERGEGIWGNYLFTIVWIVDVIRILTAQQRGQETSRRIDIAVQLFFGFMIFNATVVFGPPWYRIFAVPLGVLMFAVYWRRPGKRFFST